MDPEGVECCQQNSYTNFGVKVVDSARGRIKSKWLEAIVTEVENILMPAPIRIRIGLKMNSHIVNLLEFSTECGNRSPCGPNGNV